MRSILAAALSASLTALGACSGSAGDRAVPAKCDAAVNAALAKLIADASPGPVDGVMVCGTAFGPSRPQRAGPRGGHQLIPLQVPLDAVGRGALVEVVTNDTLDGRVTAPRRATVFALGQYFRTTARQAPFVAGIHDVHCATHRGAANGWVVVDGVRYPRAGC
jgi:hypothetical protein